MLSRGLNRSGRLTQHSRESSTSRHAVRQRESSFGSSIKTPAMFGSLLRCPSLPPHSPLLPPVSADVAPRCFRRSRRNSPLIGIRDQPRFPLWIPKGSGREFGWLARIVSTESQGRSAPSRTRLMCGAVDTGCNDTLMSLTCLHFYRGSSLCFLSSPYGAGKWLC